MSGRHPGIVARRPRGARRFSPSRTQKLSGNPRCGLFAVRPRLRAGLTGKRFLKAFAPLVVELFPAAYSSGGPRAAGLVGPVRLVAEIGGPHASCVARAVSALAPQAGFAPASHRDGPAPNERGVSLSPPFVGESVHRIERPVCPTRLASSRVTRPLAGRASVEPDERLSTHPALRARSTLAPSRRVMSPPAIGSGNAAQTSRRHPLRVCPRLDDIGRRGPRRVHADIASTVGAPAGSGEGPSTLSPRFSPAPGSSE